MANKAVIRKGGPLIEIADEHGNPLPPHVYRELERPLYYTHITMNFGARAYNANTGNRQDRVTQRRRLFQYDNAGRLCCQKGFYPKLRKILLGLGYEIIYIDKDPPKDPRIYTPDWDRLFERFTLRPKQEDCLAQIDMHEYGIIDAPPAFGKTYIMAMIASIYKHAKIDIVTKRKDVVLTIKDLLTRWIPSVGQVGGGKRRDARVTVYTADSLHHSNFNADILLADEGHELMTDRLAKQLGNYHHSRNFTFTATSDMRLDNAHYRMEGIFGPKIFKMTQQEAESYNLVAPITVQWLDVHIDPNPVAHLQSLVAQKRNGLWRNQHRNAVIAQAAREFVQREQQVLILVDTIDHALHLRKLLPEAELCYSEGALQDPEKRQRYINADLLAPHEEMTTERRLSLRQRFERRDIMCCIATGVWAVGVSFDSLNVLIRADAGASETANVQLPGRVCRVDPGSGKQCGIMVDFMDLWDGKFKGRSMARRRDYDKRGWTQLRPNGEVWAPGTRYKRVGT